MTLHPAGTGATAFKAIIPIALFFAVACAKNDAHSTAATADSIPVVANDRASRVVNLYIEAGQSNCGRPWFPGTSDGATGPEATPAQLALYDSAIKGFQIYNPAYDSLAFHDLQAGINTMLINYMATAEMGPEVSFFKAMKDSSNLREAYLLKYGYGNTDLAEWWLNTGKWSLYWYTDKVIRLLIQQNKIPVLKGFIWMQGENDATEVGWASQYLNNLDTFFTQFNRFYSNEMSSVGLGAPAYKLVMGRINGITDPTEVYRDMVRSAQAEYCATHANTVLINTDNYPLFGIHYNLSGQIDFGLDIYHVLK